MNNIKALTLPEGIEKLGRGAFGCNLIEKVILPSTLKELPKTANGVFYKNFSEKLKGNAYKGQLRYVQVFDKSGIATAFNTGGVVNPVPVTIKYVNQFGERIREDEVVYGCNYQTTYENYGKVTLGKGDNSFLDNYSGSNGTNSGNTATEIFKQEKIANAIIGQNYFREGQEYVFSKDSAPYIKGHIRPQEDVRKTITSKDNVIEYVYQTKEKIVVDKSELKKTIKVAEASKKNIKISVDGKDIVPSEKWTTSAAVESLDTAINTAKSVDGDTKVRQEAVDKAKADLEKAMKNFELSFKQGTKEESKPAEPEKPKPGEVEPSKPVEPEKPNPAKPEASKPDEAKKTNTDKAVETPKKSSKTGTNSSLTARNNMTGNTVMMPRQSKLTPEKKADTDIVKKADESKSKTALKASDKNTESKAVLEHDAENKDEKTSDNLPMYIKFIGAIAILAIAVVLYKFIMAAKQK